MSHTYTSLLVHGVFSTKERRPLLDARALPEMARIIGGTMAKSKGRLLALNGTENHVHLLGSFHQTVALSDLVRDIKAVSSGWVHERFGSMRGFGWQEGYAAFTAGKGDRDRVIGYIGGQKDHHRKKTFEQELIEMLERAEIEYDRRNLFG